MVIKYIFAAWSVGVRIFVCSEVMDRNILTHFLFIMANDAVVCATLHVFLCLFDTLFLYSPMYYALLSNSAMQSTSSKQTLFASLVIVINFGCIQFSA